MTQKCTLCGEEVEDILHCWTFKALEKHRKEIDKDIAEIDPKHLPNAVKVGIAPAMMMNPTKPFWGDAEGDEKEDEDMDEKTRLMLGCRNMHKLRYEVREFFREEKGNKHIARELIQYMTAAGECKDLPLPERVKEGCCMPEKPNVYSDGSVKNPRGLHWKVGG